MIFGRRNYDGLEFKLGDHKINICDEFKYLGVVFTKTRSLYKAIKHNIDHAKKAMHLLYKCIRNLKLQLDLQIELFNHTILPNMDAKYGDIKTQNSLKTCKINSSEL